MKSILTIPILLLHASRALHAAEAFPLNEDRNRVLREKDEDIF
jgi:hypothetical protein